MYLLFYSKYQGIQELVPRKLYKAFDSEMKKTVAVKLVEAYGFEAASVWADRHVAVSSLAVRYTCQVVAHSKLCTLLQLQ